MAIHSFNNICFKWILKREQRINIRTKRSRYDGRRYTIVWRKKNIKYGRGGGGGGVKIAPARITSNNFFLNMTQYF